MTSSAICVWVSVVDDQKPVSSDAHNPTSANTLPYPYGSGLMGHQAKILKCTRRKGVHFRLGAKS